MDVRLYDGISKEEIEKKRVTSEGKEYTINHPQDLVVDMRYLGKEKATANSQGWERSSSYYFKQIKNEHPEYFSKKNSLLIDSGRAPNVDTKYAQHFPQYAQFKGETLVHHHIGQDGQAVALPQSVHKGFGEIHSVESNLGINDKARAFSDKCAEVCEKNHSMIGQTSGSFVPHDMSTKRNTDNAFRVNNIPAKEASASNKDNAIKAARPEKAAVSADRPNAFRAQSPKQTNGEAKANHSPQKSNSQSVGKARK